jgi:hypothetical protein
MEMGCLLALQVKDFDAGGGGSAEPVSVRGEDEGVDDVTSLEGVKVLALVEIPEHGDAVLATRGSQGAIGRDGNSVDVAGVTVVVGLELELGEFPNLRRIVRVVSEAKDTTQRRVRDLGGKFSLIGRRCPLK